jgi:hypothetical protein
MLVEARGINPEWIKTGCGPREIARVFAYVPEGRYETGEEAFERRQDEKPLKRLPSRALAEELLRRIAEKPA